MDVSFDETKGVLINAKIYPLDVIESAAYVFIDRAYVLLDGDPDDKVIVKLVPKKGFEQKELELEFHNELLNYSNYKNFSEKNKDLRVAILQRALVTNNPMLIKRDNKSFEDDAKKLLDELENDEIKTDESEKINAKNKKRKIDTDKKDIPY